MGLYGDKEKTSLPYVNWQNWAEAHGVEQDEKKEVMDRIMHYNEWIKLQKDNPDEDFSEDLKRNRDFLEEYIKQGYPLKKVKGSDGYIRYVFPNFKRY